MHSENLKLTIISISAVHCVSFSMEIIMTHNFQFISQPLTFKQYKLSNYQLWNTSSLLFNMYWDLFPQRSSSRKWG